MSLNISEEDNSLDLGLALSMAGFFRLSEEEAHEIIEQVAEAVNEWKVVAKKYGISKAEQDRMANAFLQE